MKRDLSRSANRQKVRMGQVFLCDISIAKDIIDAAGLEDGDIIVEIGPGKGILTGLLANKVNNIYAVEKDRRLCAGLADKLKKHGNLSLICGDALYFNYDRLKAGFKIVSNLPYDVAAPILMRLLEYRNSLVSATLMLQKEVAERVIAEPGGKNYGRLSLAVQLFCRTRLLFYVDRYAFKPVPKVDSAVVRLDVLKEPVVTLKDEKTFFKIIRTAFNQRRKTLKNNLKNLCVTDAILGEMFKICDIDPSRRAETLTIEEFAKMSNFLDR